MTDWHADPASFKDPAGFVFKQDGLYYRSVSSIYSAEYDLLMSSGLYEFLTGKGWMLSHSEATLPGVAIPNNYKILQPQQLAFTSYAFEWSFDMLRDAALRTLSINETAMRYGMVLKDATPYNIQFPGGKPVFIDTLSFERYDAAKPWVAYRQFCEMFLFPLYLENFIQPGLTKILRLYLDGIPAEDMARLLPAKSMWNAGTWLHVHLQKAARKKGGQRKEGTFNAAKLVRLLQHLRENILSLKGRHHLQSGWSNYYDETILSRQYLDAKVGVFEQMVSGVSADTALDLGANDGFFSRIMARKAKTVVAADFDATCINRLYLGLKKEKIRSILPVVLDLSNPSPAIGFDNNERPAFLERVKADLVVALALVHHLCITKYIPFARLAEFLNRLAPQLIIEFVPDTDPKVQQITGDRAATFRWYTQANFEAAFEVFFSIIQMVPIAGSTRTLYLMQRK